MDILELGEERCGSRNTAGNGTCWARFWLEEEPGKIHCWPTSFFGTLDLRVPRESYYAIFKYNHVATLNIIYMDKVKETTYLRYFLISIDFELLG